MKIETENQHPLANYKALSGERTPGFDTILKVVQALGMELHASAIRV
jgi:DNA-binding phage protein